MAEGPAEAKAASPASTGLLRTLDNVVRTHPGWVLALVMIATLMAQAPVLGHYFFGDDFVPLADIASRGTGEYLKDLFLLQDETPNWRFLTGLFYLGAYKAFGLTAMPYLLVAVFVHTGTAALIFHLVRQVTKQVWLAALAAALFGLSPASVPTVGQVTAINNVFGGFLLMLSIVLVYEARDRRARALWAGGAALAFAAAIAANESVAVLAPVPILVALWRFSDDIEATSRGWWGRAAVLSAPFAILGGVALIGFGVCECTSAAQGATFGAGSHLFDNALIYLGRLLYPVGMEPLGDVGAAHLVAGLVAAVLALAAFVRGPAPTRIIVVFLVLALIPYLPLKLWSAPRYVYLASVPFSMLAALVVWEAASLARRLSPLVSTIVVVAVITALGLFVWQTWSQDQDFDELTSVWEEFAGGIEDTYPDLPEGSTVYVRGGSLTGPLLQCVVLPALGEVIWGNTKLFTIASDSEATYGARPGYPVFLADTIDGGFVPATLSISAGEEGVTLLPHVPPDASGNLCRDDVPGFP
ncbi:MAG: hypothetical protein J4N95_03135 [Chloroflexi bacterium]|nr:hypothetical protein [Chloroflexota bacterium]MCI0856174.1 hypothetical protein [Chloroflexota bacterium]MCI0889295.1 hypothetical protein [Chloroflexota bacterium]